MKQMKAIAPLFSGWQETMIWSCLQGHMGVAAADDWKSPSSACITVGDFSFFVFPGTAARQDCRSDAKSRY